MSGSSRHHLPHPVDYISFKVLTSNTLAKVLVFLILIALLGIT